MVGMGSSAASCFQPMTAVDGSCLKWTTRCTRCNRLWARGLRLGWGGGGDDGGGGGGGGGEEGGLLITNDVHFRESKLKHFIGRPPSAFDVIELFETDTSKTHTSKTDTSKTRRKRRKI